MNPSHHRLSQHSSRAQPTVVSRGFGEMLSFQLHGGVVGHGLDGFHVVCDLVDHYLEELMPNVRAELFPDVEGGLR